MNLTINGKNESFDKALTVEQLLGMRGLEPGMVVIERNLAIVDRKSVV
jgi:thiamine biosynthesis protein ThiS